MAILTCAIPSFPVALLVRAEPLLRERTLAVIGPDEHVLDSTPLAFLAGVMPGQSAGQARIICPDLDLRDADIATYQAEYEAFLALLDTFSSRVEPVGLGRAFLDVPDLDEPRATPFAQQVGRKVREKLGEALQPSVGCDSGKFTAQAAANHTRPGAVRVVLGDAELPFLRPLSVRQLPLPAESQLRLGYLGIRTLGQYANLPSRAVLQQFGAAGHLAQQWARGQDNRPVVPRQARVTLTVSTDFDPPLDAAPPLLLAAIRLLDQPLAQLRDTLQVVQGMRATLEFTSGQRQVDTWTFVSPTAERQHLAQRLNQRWSVGQWDGAVTSLAITLTEIQDEVGQQLSLFAQSGRTADLATLVKPLLGRFGSRRLLRAVVKHPSLARVERRVNWYEIGA